MGKKKRIPDKYQIWIDARKRFHLSHAHIQMARELGLNPKKFGKLASSKQEPWKAPLPALSSHCERNEVERSNLLIYKELRDCFASARNDYKY